MEGSGIYKSGMQRLDSGTKDNGQRNESEQDGIGLSVNLQSTDPSEGVKN